MTHTTVQTKTTAPGGRGIEPYSWGGTQLAPQAINWQGCMDERPGK